MPHNDQVISSLLGLMPGDIIFTEMPYEDSMLEDFIPVTNFKEFTTGHVAIWTGNDFTKPLAHSVSEGYRLPGIRLTNIGEGRHVVFRLKNKQLAEQIALIARRWAISVSVFDLERFDKIYPKLFWDSPYNYEKHKHDFFSIPQAITIGPGTPYSFQRASNQLYDRARNNELKKFTNNSLLRAIKFASRAEIMGPISNGMRCSSFVVSVIQAAVLSELTRKTVVKTSFKHYQSLSFAAYANTVLIENWHDSEKGKQLKVAVERDDYKEVFPFGVSIDSKYAIPNDLFSSVNQMNSDWELVGSFCLYQGGIIHLRDKNKAIEIPSFSQREEPLPIQQSNQDSDLQEQIKQEKENHVRINFFATPVRKKDDSLPSNNEKLTKKCHRELFRGP